MRTEPRTAAAERRLAARTHVATWATNAMRALGVSQTEMPALMGEKPNWFVSCVGPTKTGCLTRTQAKKLSRLAGVSLPATVREAIDVFQTAYSKVAPASELPNSTRARLELRAIVARWATLLIKDLKLDRATVATRLGVDPPWLSYRTAPSSSGRFSPTELQRFADVMQVELPKAVLDACKKLEQRAIAHRKQRTGLRPTVPGTPGALVGSRPQVAVVAPTFRGALPRRIPIYVHAVHAAGWRLPKGSEVIGRAPLSWGEDATALAVAELTQRGYKVMRLE